MTLISVQRVILIRSLNQNTQTFTWKKTFGYFCLLWTIMILLQLLPALNVVGKVGVKNGLPYCTIVNESGNFFTDIDPASSAPSNLSPGKEKVKLENQDDQSKIIKLTLITTLVSSSNHRPGLIES